MKILLAIIGCITLVSCAKSPVVSGTILSGWEPVDCSLYSEFPVDGCECIDAEQDYVSCPKNDVQVCKCDQSCTCPVTGMPDCSFCAYFIANPCPYGFSLYDPL